MPIMQLLIKSLTFLSFIFIFFILIIFNIKYQLEKMRTTYESAYQLIWINPKSIAIGLIFGNFFTREPVLKKLLGNALKIQDEGWKILNKRWALFFIGLAILNEIIW